MPNVDEVIWLLNEIWPKIVDKIPKLFLLIIGSNTPQDLAAYKGRNVSIHGRIDDLTPYFEKTLASIAPLRYGAGVKGKIVTSLSLGVPVIITSIG